MKQATVLILSVLSLSFGACSMLKDLGLGGDRVTKIEKVALKAILVPCRHANARDELDILLKESGREGSINWEKLCGGN